MLHSYFFAFFFAFAHLASTAFRARCDRCLAVMLFAVFVPPACPRHTGQYLTTTNSVSG